MSHSSLPVALLASHPPCGSLWAAPKAPLGPRFPSGQFAALTRREKALYCPFLKEGVRNVARNIVGEITLTFVRARAHSFPLSKRARLFPSAAYRRSAPPQLAWGNLTPCKLGCFGVTGRFCGNDEWADSHFSVGGGQAYPLHVGMFSCGLGIFAAQKASVSSISRWPF